MDKLIEIKKFEVLKPLSDENVRQSVRLLAVFGAKGDEVIFATKEDKVYGFGKNRFGCLGLSTADEDILKPKLNEVLSGKRLANIYYGFGHCIGLTTNGKCYAWGYNDFGQLGIGINQKQYTPQLIADKEIADKTVIVVTCGERYTLALTTDGQVFAWGQNKFGQVGCHTVDRSWVPIPVSIEESISAIACGKCHSIAITSRKQVYVWGLNDFGQLGRHPKCDKQRDKSNSFSNNPELIHGFHVSVDKAVCGPNHTILLSDKGLLYAFGLNNNGQVGNGKFAPQHKPIPIKREIKFKDIFANFDSDLSLSVSMDDKYFIWGLTQNKKKFSNPRQLTESFTQFSVFDIYVKYTRIAKTFVTIIVGDIDTSVSVSNQTSDESRKERERMFEQLIRSPTSSPLDAMNKHFMSSKHSLVSNIQTIKPIVECNASAVDEREDVFDDGFGVSGDLNQSMVERFGVLDHGFDPSGGLKQSMVERIGSLYETLETKETERTDISSCSGLSFHSIDERNEIFSGPEESEVIESTCSEWNGSVCESKNGNQLMDQRSGLFCGSEASKQSIDERIGISSESELSEHSMYKSSDIYSRSQTPIKSLDRRSHISGESETSGKSMVCSEASGQRNGVLSGNEAPKQFIDSKPIKPFALFVKHLTQAFDNRLSSDSVFVLKNKTIHFNQRLIEFRNKKFWQNCGQLSDHLNPNRFQIPNYSFKSFYAFIQYLYSIEPQFTDENCLEVLELATNYGEQELIHLCCSRLKSAINLRNICFLYEISINFKSEALKESCIGFAKSDWKAVIKTEEFQSMSENISKELFRQIFQ